MEIRTETGLDTTAASRSRRPAKDNDKAEEAGKAPDAPEAEPSAEDQVELPAGLFELIESKIAEKASKKDKAPKEPSVKVRFLPQDDLLPDREIDFPQAAIGGNLAGPRFKTQEDPNAFQTPSADKHGNYKFPIDDPRTGAVNAFVAAHKALALAEKYIGRTVNWGHKRQTNAEQLWIHPHAGQGLNAFYNNENGSINFLYAEDPRTNDLIDSANSLEVVAHETGHAILDGIRPNYIQSMDAASGGFHEAFGDVIAMLVSLQEDDVIEALYQETGGDLSESNIVSRMGEQLGRAMRGEKNAFVRNALNDAKYKHENFLPFISFKEAMALEPHQYSLPWTAANYDLLRIFVGQKMGDSSVTFVDAVKASRDELGELALRSLDLAPPGKISFKDAAIAMLQADALYNDASHLKELLAVFTMRNILTPDDAEKFVTDLATVKVLGEVGKFELPKDFNPARDAKEKGGQQFLEEKGPVLGLSTEEIKNLKYAGTTTNDRGQRILLFNEEKKVELTEPEWGATYQGNNFSIHGGLVLAFDADGKLQSLTRDEISEDDIANSKLFLRKMIDFQKNPPIIINSKGKDGDDDHEDDAHLQFLLASTKKPIEIVDGKVRRTGILY